jgi:enoyl-CoA hydratase
MNYSKFETLSIERDGHIARLKATRPELLNRIDEPAHQELIKAFRELQHDREIRAVLWTSEGRAFSAGGDLQEIYSQNSDINRRLEMYQQAKDIIHSLLDIPVPVVVSLHSHAYGLAATLVMICDAIVACPNARIADTHVKVGLVAGDGGVIGWPSIMGMMRAKYHLLTGEPITAEEGYRIGMITKLADTPEECAKVAEALALQMAALPPIAVQGTKRTFNAALRARANEVLETGLLFEQGSLATSDLLEAVEAFKEKREPTYHGH